MLMKNWSASTLPERSCSCPHRHHKGKNTSHNEMLGRCRQCRAVSPTFSTIGTSILYMQVSQCTCPLVSIPCERRAGWEWRRRSCIDACAATVSCVGTRSACPASCAARELKRLVHRSVLYTVSDAVYPRTTQDASLQSDSRAKDAARCLLDIFLRPKRKIQERAPSRRACPSKTVALARHGRRL